MNLRIRLPRFAFVAAMSVASTVPACGLLAPNDSDIFGDAGEGAVPSAGSSGNAGTNTTGGRGGTATSGTGGLPGAGGSQAGTGSSARGGQGGAAGADGGTAHSGAAAGTPANSDGGESGAAGEPSGTAGASGSAGDGSAGTGGEEPSDSLVPRDQLVLWLRADRGVTSAGGVVSEWLDQSSFGHVATPPEADASPTLLPTGLGERPALQFDGVDDMFRLPDGFDDFSEGLSFFSVFEISNEPPEGDCSGILQLSNGRSGQSPATDHVSFSRYDTRIQYSNYNSTSDVLVASFATRRTPHLVSVVQDLDAARLYFDATTAAVNDGMPLPTVIARTENQVGKNNFWFDIERSCPTFDGKIAEIILFRRPLSSDERLDVERYLRDKYACCPD